MKTVYVVMSNDYPAAVFSDENCAQDFCHAKHKEQREKLGHTRVRWGVYDFDIDDTTGADNFHRNLIQQKI